MLHRRMVRSATTQVAAFGASVTSPRMTADDGVDSGEAPAEASATVAGPPGGSAEATEGAGWLTSLSIAGIVTMPIGSGTDALISDALDEGVGISSRGEDVPLLSDATSPTADPGMRSGVPLPPSNGS